MDNAVTPFFAYLFMGEFVTETEKELNYFPKILLNNVFAIFVTRNPNIHDLMLLCSKIYIFLQ